MIGRVIRRIVHRLVRGVIVHPIRGIIMLVVLLAAAALLFLQNGLPTMSLRLPSAPRVGRQEPSATEEYMRGTTSFDAKLVWEALSDEAQTRYSSRGGNLQTLQAQMDQAKQAGAQLDKVTYIGGQALPDGTSLHFYTVLTRGPAASGQSEFVPYVFTLDQGGRITRVQ